MPYEIKILTGDKRITDWSQTYSTTEGKGKILVQHRAFGVHSVQALCIALQIIGAEIGTIKRSADHNNDFPRWSEDPNFGFFVRLLLEKP